MQNNNILKFVALFCATLVSVVGLGLMLSWQIGIIKVLQPSSSSWPVPYLACICMFFSGLALFCVFLEKKYFLPNILGGIIFSIGLIRFLEILLVTDFGLQALALNPSIFYFPVVPPPMALFGSIGFILIGMVFLLWPSSNVSLIHSIFLLLTALFAFFLALVGILNNLFPIKGNFSGTGFFPIHLYVATGLSILSIGLIAARFYFDSRMKVNLSDWLPILVTLALLFFTVAFTLTTKAGKESVIKQVVEMKANSVKVQVVEYMRNQSNILIRMVHRIELQKMPPGKDWELDANSVVNDIKELKAIAWTDVNFQIQNIIPADLKPEELFHKFSISTMLKNKFDASLKNQSALVSLSPNNKYIFISYPTYWDGVFKGVLIFLINTREFFESALKDALQNDYAIQIHSGDQLVFNSHSLNLSPTDHLKVAQPHPLYNLELRSTLFPLRALLERHFSDFEIYLILIGGFFISLAVGTLIHLWQLARSRIEAVEETQKQLDKMKKETLFILDVAQIGYWVWDIEKNFITWDSLAQNMFGTKDNMVTTIEQFQDLLDVSDREKVMKNIEIAFEKGIAYTYTFKIIGKDNSVRYTISKGRPYYDEKGDPLNLTGVCWDITEIKLSQKFLELSEEIIRTLNESVSVADANTKICHILYREFDWQVLVIWYLDKKNNRLECLHVATQSDDHDQLLEKVKTVFTESKDNPIPKHLFSHNVPISFESLTNTSFVNEKQQAIYEAGLQGVFSTPLFDGPNIIGFLEMFRKKPLQDIDEKFLNMMTSIGIDLGQFIIQKIALNDQEQLASIVTYSTDGIFSTDLDGKIKSWNAGAERIYGWSENEIIGKDVTILIPGNKIEELENLKRRLRGKTESIDRFETQRLRKDGQLIWVTNTYSGIKNHIGENSAVSVVVQEITDQKKALDSLQKSEEKFRTFVETTEEWIWEMDKNCRFTYSNPSVKKILGFDKSKIEGKELLSLIAEDKRDEIQNELKKSIEMQLGWTQRVYPYKDVNGHIRYLESNSEPIFDDKNLLIGFRGADRDITDRKRLEKSQNEFVSIVSHELRTPLTSIHGALGLVIGDEKLSPRTKELMSIAFRNSERLRNLINDVLNIEKIQLGKLDVKIRNFDIVDVIKEAILTTNSIAKSSKVSIVEDDLFSVKVMADPHRVMQVLVNLISNAIKFSFENGKVYVSMKVIKNFVHIFIKDEGIGILDEFKPKVFQRFAQADSSNSRSNEGTGLGLSICKNLVELMGGEIGFTSNTGKGSEFYFTLPFSNEG